MMATKRLYRSNDKMLAGVCCGLAEYFGIDPTIVRLLFVLVTVVTAGIPVFPAYIIMWLIIPPNPGA